LNWIKEAKADVHVTVELPVLNIDPPMTLRVAKATLSKSTSLPDPYLVAVKAAVNWFAGSARRIMPASSHFASGDSDSDTDSSGYNNYNAYPHETLPMAQSVPEFIFFGLNSDSDLDE
jgi:hypothetical protein